MTLGKKGSNLKFACLLDGCCASASEMASNIWRSLPRLARLSSEFVNGTSYLKSPAALLRIARLVSSATKSSSSAVSASVSPVSEKTPYEIELERLQGQDKVSTDYMKRWISQR